MYLVRLNRACSGDSCIFVASSPDLRIFKPCTWSQNLQNFTEMLPESQMYEGPGLRKIRVGSESDQGSEISL